MADGQGGDRGRQIGERRSLVGELSTDFRFRHTGGKRTRDCVFAVSRAHVIRIGRPYDQRCAGVRGLEARCQRFARLGERAVGLAVGIEPWASNGVNRRFGQRAGREQHAPRIIAPHEAAVDEPLGRKVFPGAARFDLGGVLREADGRQERDLDA